MDNYKAMYTKLFNAMTDAITLLQQAQQESEKIYISTNNESTLTVLKGVRNENSGENERGS